jgi:predicted glycosyltransferase
MRALIANGPAMYREVISAALRELRPDIEIFTAEPEDLETEFLRLLPRLVICSRLMTIRSIRNYIPEDR